MRQEACTPPGFEPDSGPQNRGVSCIADAIPIPGARNADQAKEQVGALGWSLDGNQVAIIEEKLEALKLARS